MRNASLFDGAVDLAPAPHTVAGTTDGAAASADVLVTFGRLASSPTTLGACVLANDTSGGLGITIRVDGNASSVAVGSCADAMAGNLRADIRAPTLLILHPSKRMYKRMSKRTSKRTSKHMSKHMSKHTSKRMSKRMSKRTSKRTSKRRARQ